MISSSDSSLVAVHLFVVSYVLFVDSLLFIYSTAIGKQLTEADKND